ncbi:MAG TPA: DUF4214 domain-containing protein [Gemmataceae bacterium]|nr:DUF4214 domain-containing protein [Gemmataceae bacterium]
MMSNTRSSRSNRTTLTFEPLEERTLMNAGFLDTSFGNNGIATINLGSSYQSSSAAAVVAEPNGQIVAAGTAITQLQGNPGAFMVARFNNDGSLDSSFGGKGYVISSFLGRADTVAVQADGKILVAGFNDFANPVVAGDQQGFLVARYNTDGSLDAGFGNGGVVETSFTSLPYPFGASASTVLVQKDGKIIVAGTQGGPEAITELVRYNTDGSLDKSFGSNGTTVGGGGVPAGNSGALLQPDGKILVAAAPPGLFFGQSWEVARFNADGSIDTTFGNKGIAPIFAQGTGTTLSLVLQPDGRILAASPNWANPPGGAIARLNPDGTLDNTFGTGGVVYTSAAGVLAVQSDGHILLLGNTANTVSEPLDSYLANGQIDTTFGAGGQAVPAPSITAPQFGAPGLTLEPDGRILAAGSDTTSHSFTLVRYFGDTSNANFVAHLYQDLLGRSASAGEVSAWVQFIDQSHAPHAQVALAIEHSAEYRVHLVETLFGQYLHRAADPSGLAVWTNFLAAGGTVEGLRTGLISSSEYFQINGGVNPGFVAQVYLDVLGRTAQAREDEVWANLLQAGVSRSTVVAIIVASPEAARNEVEGLYHLLLHRAADPTGLAVLTALHESGTPTDQIAAFLAGSNEYFGRP